MTYETTILNIQHRTIDHRSGRRQQRQPKKMNA